LSTESHASRPKPDESRETPDADGVTSRGVDALFPLFYGELRRIAHRQLGNEATGHTLDTTGLVHEAYLRIATQANSVHLGEERLFALAARAMRRVLVDYARQRKALRRGGGAQPVTLDAGTGGDYRAAPADGLTIEGEQRAEELLALEAALVRLESSDPRLSRVVELRFYAGLTEAKVAELLGVTERTVRRDWVRARNWLYAEVQKAHT
jgi:RNA polymerase sigma factor (TIGR02999 family)